MNAENAVVWAGIGVIALVALYLKGYLPFTMPWIKSEAVTVVQPVVHKIEVAAVGELETLAAAMVAKAREVAEKDLNAQKVEEVTQGLLAHFKGLSPAVVPTKPSGATEAGPPPAR